MQILVPEWVWGCMFAFTAFLLSLPTGFFLAVWYINRRLRKQAEHVLQQMYRNQMH